MAAGGVAVIREPARPHARPPPPPPLPAQVPVEFDLVTAVLSFSYIEDIQGARPCASPPAAAAAAPSLLQLLTDIRAPAAFTSTCPALPACLRCLPPAAAAAERLEVLKCYMKWGARIAVFDFEKSGVLDK